MNKPKQSGLCIQLISVHGLIRGTNMELGRDADTGGQTLYVVKLARALGRHPNVQRVDILTRMVIDSKISDEYAEPQERLDGNVKIIRIPCGPRRYLRKEVLWPYLDSFADGIIKHLQQLGYKPDLVHGHYADGGYVAARLAAMLGAPMGFTGHSLGRLKLQQLLEKGVKQETIEERFRITQRIEAEEIALDSAALVIASTRQEVQKQYNLYDKYQPSRMVVIPPGVDVDHFDPKERPAPRSTPIYKEISRFLREPDKPMILLLARPDPKKNISGIIQVYGKSQQLQKLANLVIVAGIRDDICEMDRVTRDVLTEIFSLVDAYDLYGKVAYPKKHNPEDIPDLYHAAMELGGVFINPALSEGFGLTLIEAAASGLPVVATNIGGPVEIIENCNNGVLVDPTDEAAIENALKEVLTNKEQWKQWSTAGIEGARKNYSWSIHIERYVKAAEQVIGQQTTRKVRRGTKSSLVTIDRALITDMDNTLLGDQESLDHLLKILENADVPIGFGVATGRNSDLAMEGLAEWNVPTPNFVISSVGTGIRYGPNLVEDQSWKRHISYRWRPEEIREVLALVPGLELQTTEGQREFKVSYNVDPEQSPSQVEVARLLRQAGLSAKVIYSHQQFLDIIPIRASKGMAIRFLAMKWDIPFEQILVAGDSGNDEEMLTGNTPAVVVGNHSPELEHLKGMPLIYFAEACNAQGIIEAIEYFDFLGNIRIPEKTELDENEEYQD